MLFNHDHFFLRKSLFDPDITTRLTEAHSTPITMKKIQIPFPRVPLSAPAPERLTLRRTKPAKPTAKLHVFAPSSLSPGRKKWARSAVISGTDPTIIAAVEAWTREGELVAGTFGTDVGSMFIAESAFHTESNAGKVVDAYLSCHLQHWGYKVRDCQTYNPHLASLGYEEVSLSDYLHLLKQTAGIKAPSGKWTVDGRLDIAQWKPAVPGSQLRD